MTASAAHAGCMGEILAGGIRRGFQDVEVAHQVSLVIDPQAVVAGLQAFAVLEMECRKRVQDQVGGVSFGGTRWRDAHGRSDEISEEILPHEPERHGGIRCYS